jgi:hypothetical protein
MTSKCFILIFLFFLSSQNNFAQLSLRLNLEGGYYQSTSKSIAESGQKDATGRLDGEIGYKYINANEILSLKLRARPEIYGLNNNLKILKLRASAGYFSGNKDFTWGINLTGQKNNYSGRNVNLNFQDLIFMLESLTEISNNISLKLNSGYGYQRISNDINQKMNLIFLDAEIIQRVFNNAKLGYGVYSERFFLNNNYNIESTANKGWRLGPHVSFDYLRFFIINFDYRYLFHISEVTQSPSYEHWIRFVAGKLIAENWSVFVLTDYYFRKYTIKKYLESPYLYLYTPINEDNRIYLKLAYSISEIMEVYFKVGYFRENLYNNYSFAGWNFLAGFEFEK